MGSRILVYGTRAAAVGLIALIGVMAPLYILPKASAREYFNTQFFYVASGTSFYVFLIGGIMAVIRFFRWCTSMMEKFYMNRIR